MMKSMMLALGMSVVSFAVHAGEIVPVGPNCAYVKGASDSRRVYSDGRVWDYNCQTGWRNTANVGREGYQSIAARVEQQNNTISSYGNSNTSIYSRQNSNTSIHSGGTSNTTIAGQGDSNTTIRNEGRKNITIEGGGPATVRYSGSSARSGLSNNYYNGR